VTAIRISALDHPNVVSGKDLIPGAITREGLERMLGRYHGDKESPMYKSRARGISPAQGTDSVIRLEWLYKAALKWEEYCGEEATKSLEGLPYYVGQDVANSEEGDKAARAIGRGDILESVTSEACPDAGQLGHRLAKDLEALGIDGADVCVDGVGVGASTINVLREHEITVGEDCTGGPVERVTDVEQYASLRSQMLWQLREDLQAGKIGLPLDEELFADLVTPKYEIRLQKIRVEEKKEIRKRLSRSPDKGDAVVYWNWIRAKRYNIGAMAPPIENPKEKRTFSSALKDPSPYHAERKRKW
jgi:hypothetical protein